LWPANPVSANPCAPRITLGGVRIRPAANFAEEMRLSLSR